MPKQLADGLAIGLSESTEAESGSLDTISSPCYNFIKFSLTVEPEWNSDSCAVLSR